jgi:hypothetical protein
MIAFASIILACAIIVGLAWAALIVIWYGKQIDDEVNSDGP